MYFALSILLPPLENKGREGFPGARHASPSPPRYGGDGSAQSSARVAGFVVRGAARAQQINLHPLPYAFQPPGH